jgi:anti-anti-sigma factor
MEMSVLEKSGHSIIILKGEFDLSDIDKFEKEAAHLLTKFNKIYIDCRQLEYIDSAGIGQFIKMQNKLAKTEGGEFYIAGVNEFITRIMSIANLTTYFKIISIEELLEVF